MTVSIGELMIEKELAAYKALVAWLEEVVEVAQEFERLGLDVPAPLLRVLGAEIKPKSEPY